MVTNEGKVKVKVKLRLLSIKDDLELELKEGDELYLSLPVAGG